MNLRYIAEELFDDRRIQAGGGVPVGFFAATALVSDMSDFDEEAERERLREKFEHDRRKRKSTQRMSELLLKGATMTNRHCEECSDPIFRYEGQEFCPTCQRPTDGEGEAAPAADEEPAGTGSEDTVEVTPEPDDAGTEPVDGEANADRTEANAGRVADVDPTGAAGGSNVGSDTGDGRAARRGRAQSSPDRRAAEESADAARASLVRTLTRFARAAEETDDPRRAAERLTAAREAAEALAALER